MNNFFDKNKFIASGLAIAAVVCLSFACYQYFRIEFIAKAPVASAAEFLKAIPIFSSAMNPKDMRVNDVAPDGSNGYTILGNTQFFLLNNNIWLARFDGADNLTWFYEYDGGNAELGNSIKQVSDGYVVVGYPTITKFRLDGSVAWSEILRIVSISTNIPPFSASVNCPVTGSFVFVITGAQPGYLVFGSDTCSDMGGYENMYYFRLDLNGNVIAQSGNICAGIFGTDQKDHLTSVVRNNFGNYVVVGYRETSNMLNRQHPEYGIIDGLNLCIGNSLIGFKVLHVNDTTDYRFNDIMQNNLSDNSYLAIGNTFLVKFNQSLGIDATYGIGGSSIESERTGGVYNYIISNGHVLTKLSSALGEIWSSDLPDSDISKAWPAFFLNPTEYLAIGEKGLLNCNNNNYRHAVIARTSSIGRIGNCPNCSGVASMPAYTAPTFSEEESIGSLMTKPTSVAINSYSFNNITSVSGSNAPVTLCPMHALSVETYPTTFVGVYSAGLEGCQKVIGECQSMSTFFRYGTPGNCFNNQTSFTGQPDENTKFGRTINSLNQNTNYCYQACAQNSLGTYCDPILRYFTTLQITPPTVTTQDADGIKYNRANFHGEITNINNQNADTRGFDYAPDTFYSLNGAYNNGWTEAGSFGVGAFEHLVAGLNPSTTYHYRAKAHNSAAQNFGWGYGLDRTFITDKSYNIHGWGYNANIGWISFNALECDVDDNGYVDVGCGGDNATTELIYYGVNLDNFTYNFSGYAYSPAVGWIAFERAKVCTADTSIYCRVDQDCVDAGVGGACNTDDPDTPPDFAFSANCFNPSNCDEPGHNCTACFNTTDRKAYGWAKILSLGAGGWISLNSAFNELSVDWTDNHFRGWAWNGNDDDSGIGWISFNCADYKTCSGGANNGQMCLLDESNCPGGACVDTCLNFSAYDVYIQGFKWPPYVTFPVDGTATQQSDLCTSQLYYWIRWIYNDDQGPPQSGRNIQIRKNGAATWDAINLVANVTDNSSAQQYQFENYIPGPGSIEYNTTYNWRVRVLDGDGLWSKFEEGPNFTTALHDYPTPSFSFTPAVIHKNEEVEFQDTSVAYGTAMIGSWSWTFTDATPNTSVLPNPIVIFNTEGDNKPITLIVTDTDGYQCSITDITNIDVKISLPKWIER